MIQISPANFVWSHINLRTAQAHIPIPTWNRHPALLTVKRHPYKSLIFSLSNEPQTHVITIVQTCSAIYTVYTDSGMSGGGKDQGSMRHLHEIVPSRQCSSGDVVFR